MPRSSTTHPTLHLAIDVQSRYLRSLKGRRQHDFPEGIRQFADILRQHDIPTIWVALLEKFKFHPRRAAWTRTGAEQRHDKQLQKFDLVRAAARLDEDVFIKRTNNAFERLLSDRLRSYHTGTLIITGMNTRFCVSATVLGAIKDHFRCLVVTDLLADSSADNSLDADPSWHRESVERSLLGRIRKSVTEPRKQIVLQSRVEFCTSGELLGTRRSGSALVKKMAKVMCGRKKPLITSD